MGDGGCASVKEGGGKGGGGGEGCPFRTTLIVA
jgi:hypothetical protein